MKTRVLAGGLVLFLFLSTSPGASGASEPVEFRADLGFDEIVAAGAVRLEGAAWALHMPMHPHSPAPETAVLRLEGERIHVAEHYRTYAGTPALMVEKPEESGVREQNLVGATLRLVEARNDVQFLATALPGAPAGPRVEMSTPMAFLQPLPRVDVSLWPRVPGLEPPADFQRTFERDAPAIKATAGAGSQVITVSGDFVLHLWDVDLEEVGAEGRLFRSGEHRFQGQGSTEITPDGAVFESRIQLLTLTVRGGVLSFLFADRAVDLYQDANAFTAINKGSWDLTGARGTVAWGKARMDLNEASSLHFAGTLQADFAMDGGPAVARWTGVATVVDLTGEPVSTSGVVVTARGSSWPLLAGMGVLLVVTGAGVTVGVRKWRDRPEREYEKLLEWAESSMAEGGAPNAVVAKGIALLKLGRAQEVVESFAPGFDAEAPGAAVKAYLLSLAHIDLAERDVAAEWISLAVRLHPGFLEELRENDRFFPIRDHPRVVACLQRDDGGPAYA